MAARLKQSGEKPQFGGKIAVHIGVVIEMVAAEIGKSGDMKAQTVKPVLFQPMAARFEGKMGHADLG